MSGTTLDLVRSVLSGQRLLIVGGDAREQAFGRLEDAFDLAAVLHCPTRRSDPSPRRFQSMLPKSGAILVVCLVGLSRTNHGALLHQQCRALRIPWIDCFRIPHPNQLAALIEELHLLDALSHRRHQLGGVP